MYRSEWRTMREFEVDLINSEKSALVENYSYQGQEPERRNGLA